MKKQEILKQVGMVKEVTVEAIEALNNVGTKVAKKVAKDLENHEGQLFTDGTTITFSPYNLTKEKKTQIEKAMGMEVVALNQVLEAKGMKQEWRESGAWDEIVTLEEEEVQEEAVEEMSNYTSIKVPQKYQDKLELVEKDGDGYWAYAREGFIFKGMGCATAHEDTQSDLLKMIRTIQPQ